MWADGGFELVFEFAKVRLPPQVAGDLFAGDFHVVEVRRHGDFIVAEVEQADGGGAVLQWSGPDLRSRVRGASSRTQGHRSTRVRAPAPISARAPVTPMTAAA